MVFGGFDGKSGGNSGNSGGNKVWPLTGRYVLQWTRTGSPLISTSIPLGPIAFAHDNAYITGHEIEHVHQEIRDCGQCRAVWNLFLAASAERYKAEGKFVFYNEMSARLPKLLKEDERLTGLPHRAAQMTVQKLDRALKDCVKSKGKARRGFPKFKRYSDRSDAFSFVGREVRVEPGRVRLPKIGWLRTRGLMLPDGADLKQVAVTQEPCGWHVSPCLPTKQSPVWRAADTDEAGHAFQ